MRYIVIGDTHGCITELKELWSLVKPTYKDIVISLGDTVDRGPNSGAVVSWFMENQAVLVLGNHEKRLLKWKQGEERNLKPNPTFVNQIHIDSINSINGHKNSKELWTYLKNAIPRYTFEVAGRTYDCIHAGYEPLKGRRTKFSSMQHIRNVDKDTLKPTRNMHVKRGQSILWAKAWKGPEIVLFGHEAFRNVKVFDYAIGLDTGCAYGGKLTAFVVDDKGNQEFYSVDSHRNYSKYYHK